MTAVRLAQMAKGLLGTLVVIALAAPAAFAQPSVKAIFEKHNLLGTFAIDCGRPASKNNFYFINRLLDPDHVQRDRMVGRTDRDLIIYIDKVTEAKPNEIALSGTREDKPTDGVWRIERKGDDVRVLVVESSFDGKKLISGGKDVNNGRDYPWQNKCGK